MTPDQLLSKMREVCATLPKPSEGSHHDSIAFKSNGKMFATWREKDGDSLIVVGLEPEHASALVDEDPRFTRYPNAKHTVQIHGSAIDDFAEIAPLVRESCALLTAATAKAKPRPPAKKKSRAR